MGRLPRLRARLAAFAALGALATLARTAAADPEPLVFDGDVPDDGLDHFFVYFDVPDGIEEITVKHDDLSDKNILDWGVEEPDGAFRGYGGGNSEDAVFGHYAASRSYLAGAIKPGKWRVNVGKAKIVEKPAKYHVEVDLHTVASLPPWTPADHAPYTTGGTNKLTERWYAGDFHVHTRESGDATAPIDTDIALAKSRGLDFIETSDHNTVSQMLLFAAAQAKNPDFLLVPGIEFTTYKGHANAIGATQWVDHKIGQPGITIDGAIDQVGAQGALFSINHPVLDVGDLCIGCAWKYDVDPKKIGGVEIATHGLHEGGLLFSAQAIAFWDALLDKGAKVPALGGSDDHKGGVDEGTTLPGLVGNPTTMVYARELSVPAILDAIRLGATVVKLEDPTDPMVELELANTKGGARIGYPGTRLTARSIVLRVKVSDIAAARADQIRLVKNGVPLDPVDIEGDPFVYETVVDAPKAGEDRWRAEALVEGKPETVTSHVWLSFAADGNQVPADEVDEGCSTGGASAGGEAPMLWPALGAIAATLLLRRRRLSARA